MSGVVVIFGTPVDTIWLLPTVLLLLVLMGWLAWEPKPAPSTPVTRPSRPLREPDGLTRAYQAATAESPLPLLDLLEDRVNATVYSRFGIPFGKMPITLARYTDDSGPPDLRHIMWRVRQLRNRAARLERPDWKARLFPNYNARRSAALKKKIATTVDWIDLFVERRPGTMS